MIKAFLNLYDCNWFIKAAIIGVFKIEKSVFQAFQKNRSWLKKWKKYVFNKKNDFFWLKSDFFWVKKTYQQFTNHPLFVYIIEKQVFTKFSIPKNLFELLNSLIFTPK